MAVSPLARFAARAAVPLYAAVGESSLEAVEHLTLREEVRFALSPRHASVLLVCGAFRVADQVALRRLHDQLPHPRATLCWDCAADLQMPQAEHLTANDDPLPRLRVLYHDLLTKKRASEADLLPDQSPQPWEGRGDHGQGGEGMMGGAPYGRPMAMPDDDLRDGLQLDACTVRLGPFIPCWPPGLVLELTFQGDVVQQAQVIHPPYYSPAYAAPSVARRLGDVARVLFLLQLIPQAESVLRLAYRKECVTSAEVAGLSRRLRRWGVFATIPPNLGRLNAGAAEVMSLTCNDNGFSNIQARLRQWLDEAEEATLVNGGNPGPAHTDSAIASPHPIPHLAELLTGLEWHEARLIIASFDAMTLQSLTSTDGDDQSPAPGDVAE